MAAAALVIAGTLGVASAEAPASAPVRTVSVGGTGQAPITIEANTAAADEAYRQAMAAAVTDGRGKAEFLAGQTGATLGPVQSIAEGGGDVDCTSPETGYVEYRGQEPDFGYSTATSDVVAPEAARSVSSGPTVAPTKNKTIHKKKHKKPTAKNASAVTCVVSAQLSLSYELS